jgi:putative peptidoglycan lipid II flippase
MIVGQNLASLLDTGSIVALRIANRLINFPLGIFAMGLSTAIFPTLAAQAAKQELTELKETFSFGLRLVFYITVPSAVGMAVLRVPIVRLLFETGEFTSQDTAITAYALLFYSAGLVAQAGLQILTRVFYSLQDTVTPVKVGLITVILNFGISMVLLTWTNLDLGGLALAYSVTSLIQMLLLIVSLRKKLGGIDGSRILKTAAYAGAASAVMALVTHYTAVFAAGFVNLASPSGRLLQTGGAIAAGVLVYAVVTIILRMDEPLFVLEMIKGRLARTGRR